MLYSKQGYKDNCFQFLSTKSPFQFVNSQWLFYIVKNLVYQIGIKALWYTKSQKTVINYQY